MRSMHPLLDALEVLGTDCAWRVVTRSGFRQLDKNVAVEWRNLPLGASAYVVNNQSGILLDRGLNLHNRVSFSCPARAFCLVDDNKGTTESSMELLERANAGDAPALAMLLVRHLPRWRRWAINRSRWARDIAGPVQQTFFQALDWQVDDGVLLWFRLLQVRILGPHFATAL